MTSAYKSLLVLLVAGTALTAPVSAKAQILSYGDVTGSGRSGGYGADQDGFAEVEDDVDQLETPARTKKIKLSPYIEAQQVAFAELAPGNEVLTYSVLSAGIDGTISGRNNQASVSARYERRFGWGTAQDSDAVSGIARASMAVVPQAVKLEVGGIAARTSAERNGAAIAGGLDFGDSVTQIYSVYAGPQLSTRVGDVAVNGSYRFGYTRVKSPDAVIVAPSSPAVDIVDRSLSHNASVYAGVKPGEVLPIGLGVGGGYNREDISNLDQRIEDRWARADVTVPLSPTFNVVGGVGYEKSQVSSRDAVRNPATGAAVIGADGRYVTNTAAPRVIAYNAEGLIWDGGVVWRPSRRTVLEGRVGRRYGSMSYTGNFAYAPNSNSSLNLSVYDSINGFGGQLTNALSALPTEFEAVRNPFNGSLGGCVANSGALSNGQSSCLSNALGSVRSAVFRSRGVTASYSVSGSRFQSGIGAGFDRRKFIAAPGTVLAQANDVVDQNIWVAAYLNGKIDRSSGFSTTVYGNLYDSGDAAIGDTTSVGATAAYYRQLTGKFTATAAIGIDGVRRDSQPDAWTSQAMVGLRYSF